MENLSILIVDDDVQFGRLVNRVVSKMGHTVEQIVSSREIMQRYVQFSPDVIFLDIFMPDLDGLEIAKWLTEQNFAGRLIFMTGHDPAFLTAAKTVVEDRISAAIATLEKPARIEEIRAVLEGPQASASIPAPAEPAIAASNERRNNARMKTLKAATIIYQFESCTMKCIILDISETGARLKPAEPVHLPGTFRLALDHGASFNCKVVRRMDDQMGVQFV
jgi:CheY-like chemotaxis protein